jgi:hypothetical protein
MERIGKFGHSVSYVFGWFLRFFFLAFGGLAVWAVVWGAFLAPPAPPPTAAEQEREQARKDAVANDQKRKLETERYLCRKMTACKKYDQVRLECATAGNFKTCLRIKMGDDAKYSDVCSGYNEGAPALPLDPETPDALRCFVLNNL